MPSFVEIGPPVSEKILKGFYHKLTWWSSWSCDPEAENNVRSPYPRRLHVKYGYDGPSGFGGEDL